MNSEIKTKWVAALRSGQYSQGKNFLHRVASDGESQYCCLGVLSELARQHGVIETPECISTSIPASELPDEMEDIYEPGPQHEVYMYDGITEVLPSLVASWAGLGFDNVGMFELHYSDDPEALGVDERNTSLAELNDAGRNFQEIADVIERYF